MFMAKSQYLQHIKKHIHINVQNTKTPFSRSANLPAVPCLKPTQHICIYIYAKPQIISQDHFQYNTLSSTSATAPIMCRAPSFCLESTLGLVSTDMQKPMALFRTSLRLAVAVWNTVCAAITGDRKSSNTSGHTKQRVGSKQGHPFQAQMPALLHSPF